MPVPTESATSLPTPSETATASPTWTETLVATITGTAGITETPSATATGSGTPTASWTPMLEGTPTETATFLPTLTLDFPTPVRTLMPEPVMPEIEAISFDAPYVSDWDYAEEVLEPRDSGFALHFRSEWYVRSRVPEQNDIILTANVRMTGGRFSIYTHVTDIAAYRLATSASGLVELYRGEQVVASTTIGAIPDTWITVRFSSTSGNLRAAVQGVEVLTFADDAPLPPGKVWLGVDGIPEGEIWADEIAVSGNIPLPEIVPPVTDAAMIAAAGDLSAQSGTEMIVFDYHLGGGNYEIYRLTAAGTGLTNLSNLPTTAEFDPVLSPDGSKIAFVSNRNTPNGNYNIWVMNSDGSNRRQITAHTANDYSPTWRRDGQALAFVSNRNNNETIFVIGVNETASQGGVFAATGKNPDYSSVTDELVFSNYSGVSNSNDIFVMNLTPGFITSPYFVASAPSASDFEPTWANDGNTLLFRALTTPAGGNPAMLNAIYTVARPSGAWGGITNLTQQNSSYGPIKPDYSPSGTQVIAWYDTGIFMGNVPTQAGQYLLFATNPIANTNYNTNNADWHIYDPTPPPTGTGIGLTGTYHLGTNLSSPVGIRLDPTINFNFVSTPPTAVGIPFTSIHDFSVRWTGLLYAPYTGNYIFHGSSDDGIRVTVDGLSLFTGQWRDRAGRLPDSAPVPLMANQPYSIEIDYYSGEPGGAGIYLGWSLPGEFGEQVIPQQYLYPSATHTATPTFTPTRTLTPTATNTPTPQPCTSGTDDIGSIANGPVRFYIQPSLDPESYLFEISNGNLPGRTTTIPANRPYLWSPAAQPGSLTVNTIDLIARVGNIGWVDPDVEWYQARINGTYTGYIPRTTTNGTQILGLRCTTPTGLGAPSPDAGMPSVGSPQIFTMARVPLFDGLQPPAVMGALGLHLGTGTGAPGATIDLVPRNFEFCIDSNANLSSCDPQQPIPVYVPVSGCALLTNSPSTSNPGTNVADTVVINTAMSINNGTCAGLENNGEPHVVVSHVDWNPSLGLTTNNWIPIQTGQLLGFLCNSQTAIPVCNTRQGQIPTHVAFQLRTVNFSALPNHNQQPTEVIPFLAMQTSSQTLCLYDNWAFSLASPVNPQIQPNSLRGCP